MTSTVVMRDTRKKSSYSMQPAPGFQVLLRDTSKNEAEIYALHAWMQMSDVINQNPGNYVGSMRDLHDDQVNSQHYLSSQGFI